MDRAGQGAAGERKWASSAGFDQRRVSGAAWAAISGGAPGACRTWRGRGDWLQSGSGVTE